MGIYSSVLSTTVVAVGIVPLHGRITLHAWEDNAIDGNVN